MSVVPRWPIANEYPEKYTAFAPWYIASSAPCGSWTPGAKTNGSVAGRRRSVPRPARSLHRGRPARQREPRGGGAPPHAARAHGAAPNARGRPGDRPLRAQPPRYGAHRRRPGPPPVRAARDRADARRAQGGRAAADGEGRRAPHRRRARGQYVPTPGAAQVVPVDASARAHRRAHRPHRGGPRDGPPPRGGPRRGPSGAAPGRGAHPRLRRRAHPRRGRGAPVRAARPGPRARARRRSPHPVRRASSYYELTSSLVRQAGVVPESVIELDNVEAAKKMVLAGLGVALLPP